MKRFSRLGLIFVLSAMGLLGQASPTPAPHPAVPSARIAVISDAETKDLAALVTADLSNRPDITLVERDELAKVGDELKLQQLAGSDAVALGKLIGADGLLFLDKNGDNLNARFTAVGLGFVLFDLPIPPGVEPASLAKSLSDRMALFTSKLKLPPDKAIPLSLLNLRAVLNSGNDEMEHQLTLLLESRLAAIPEYVVLERRHADALGFEHSVLTPTPPDVLKGAYLIDGSFRPAGIDAEGEIVVSLRLRSPKTRQETSFEVQGSGKDLPTLVNVMVDKIGHEIGSTNSPANRHPLDEATEYLHEAFWDWQNSTDKATMEALDSAELLGEKSPDLHNLRIQVLCEMDRPEPGHREGLGVNAPPLDKRVELLQRAMREMIEVHALETPPALGPPGQDPIDRRGGLDYQLIERASDLLRDLEASPLTDLSDSFRQELRTFVDFDPLHGEVPKAMTMVREVDVDDLANSLDEIFAFLLYRLTRDHLFYSSDPANFCPRFCKTPAERQAAFDKYMLELKAAPDGRLPWLAISCLHRDAATRDELYPQFLHELWDQRGNLYQPVGFRRYVKAAAQIDADVRKKYARQSLPLFHYWLSKPDEAAPSEVTDFMPLEWYSPEDIDGIWSDLQTQKALQAEGINYEAQFLLNDFEQVVWAKFPSRKPSDPDASRPRMTINRYWFGKDLVEPDADVDVVVGLPAARYCISPLAPSPDGSGVWGLTWRWDSNAEGSGIFEVQLPDMASKRIAMECVRPIQAIRTSNAYYVTHGVFGKRVGQPRLDEHYLTRYDLHAQTWTERRLTDITASGAIDDLNDQIYLSLNSYSSPDPTTWGSGVARYDWDTDKLSILASSRRKPAQNQFDDRGRYDVSLFVGPGNKPCVLAPEGVYYIQEKPGTWPRLDLDLPIYGAKLINLGYQTLIASNGGEVVLIDPAKPAPIPLMAPTEPAEWRPVPGKSTMKKQLPAWASTAVWKYRPEWAPFRYVFPLTYRNGHLYRLFYPNSQRPYYELLVFNPGQADPVRIPLRFLFKGSEATAHNILKWMSNEYTPYAEYGLVATDQGICLSNDWGFWFVPFSDIDAYMKSNPNLVHSP